MSHSNPALLALTALLAVVALVLLIARARLNAFIAITIVSFALGLAAGMPPAGVVRAFQEGVGTTLGFIAVVVGLGTIFGKLLSESGGARVVAVTATRAVPAGALPWAVALVGFVVGLPVFFSVGLVLLFPIVARLAETAQLPLLSLALPLVAGLSASHGLVPPHPGPLAAIDRLGADMGRSIVYAILAGVPATLIAGPLFARAAGSAWRQAFRPVVPTPVPSATPTPASHANSTSHPITAPGFAITVITILLPVALMLLATFADTRLPADSTLRRWIDFIGSPAVALLVATLVAYRVFGTACGFDAKMLLRFSEESVGPIAGVLLVVGAGGGFGRVLDQAGIGQAISSSVAGLSISPLVLGWLIAALLRIAVGSATVAITTAASLVAPLAAATPGTNRELLVIALGAGSLIASHVNDAGFWLVKEYLGLDVGTTLRTWTVIETIISFVALAMVALLGVL
jgi:gluconate:H+ symporter, GntP family